jgi:trehalose utilization protein
VTVWNEGRHEKKDPVIGKVYPEGMHRVIPCFCANSACFYKLVQIEGISIFQNGTFMPK